MKIRSEFLIPIKSYADNTPEATPDILDCSLGENPYGFTPAAAAALRDFDPERMAHYPHSHRASGAIIRHWAGQAKLAADNILLCDGSIAALYLINSLFSTPGAQVVGYAPTFTDMVVNVKMLGMTYTAVPMSPAENFKADPDALLAAITPETALVYIDNPNNPTGQTMPLEDVERIVGRAAEVGAYILLDEAYGDFIPREESAVALLDRYPNLIVTRTFSKGFGLAGLRAGCILASPEVIGYLGKVSNPYMMNELTREIVAAALTDGGYPASHAAEFEAAKRALAAQTGKNVTLLHTDYRVPICTLRHRDSGANLQKLLYGNGVLTVSGAEFDGLDAAAVRLRIPKGAETEKLFQAVGLIDRD